MGAIADQQIILTDMIKKQLYVVGDMVNGSLSFHKSISDANRELQDYIKDAMTCGIENGLSLEEAETEAQDMFYMERIVIEDVSSLKEALYKTGRSLRGETLEEFLLDNFGLMASVFM